MPEKTQTPPDMSEFERASWALERMTGYQFMSMVALGLPAQTRPDRVSFEVMEVMGYDPAIYMPELALTGPSRDPELYYVRHGNPRVIAETEAWLWRLLPDLLPAITRAFFFGRAPLVFDWESADLLLEVDRGQGSVRNERFANHVHYGFLHDMSPAEGLPRTDNDRIVSIETADGSRYGGEDLESLGQIRGYLAVWDRQFKRVHGQASRRRAYEPWFSANHGRLWRARYQERSVDPLRVGYAPEGKITLANGRQVDAIKLLRTMLVAARNGSSLALPATLLGDGSTRAWEVDVVATPERDKVFQQAADHHDARMMLACLWPKDGDVDTSLYEAFIQQIADFCAKEVQKIVATVHWLNHGVNSTPPQILANDIPKAKKRILKEVLSNVSGAVHHLKDGRTYTLGELVHPEILEQLGVRARTVEEAAHFGDSEGGTGQPGRNRELDSDREVRRDNARTEEGENDTGGEREDGEMIRVNAPAGGGEGAAAESAAGLVTSGGAPRGQVFGYHLQQAVVKINEARAQLGLPPVDRGDMTVPEFLSMLKREEASVVGDLQPDGAGQPDDARTEEGQNDTGGDDMERDERGEQ